ncbi:MAG TPA: helix-turn-helix transcriptional regulator [Thermoanaerobaculia bacterium]|nr:helix-turn-helix transcriptional regulator [Thermoanaerobaculia bacterium]
MKAQRPLSAEAQAANAAWVEEQIVELNLQALRQQLGVTQAELAAVSGFAQGEISRIEQREDHMVSTLRRLVRSLGGELEVHARFPNGRDIRLIGI